MSFVGTICVEFTNFYKNFDFVPNNITQLLQHDNRQLPGLSKQILLKLLGRYDGTVQLFQAAQSVSSKHRAIFIEKLNLQSVQQYAQVWEEVRTNFLSENMRIRRISFDLIVKLTMLLLHEGLV